MLTERMVAQDEKLVARIKSAKPVGQPMGAEEFKTWLESLR